MKLFSNYPIWKIALGLDAKNIVGFLAVFFASCLAALLEGLSFSCILLGFTELNGDKLPTFPFARYLVLLSENFDSIGIFVVCVIVAIVLQAARSAITYVAQLVSTSLVVRIQISAQQKIFEQIFRFSFQSISRYKVGDLIEYTRIPLPLPSILLDAMQKILISVLMIAACGLLMLLLSPLLTFLVFFAFTFCSLIQKRLINKIETASKKQADDTVELSKNSVQYLHGLRAIYTFDRQREVLKNLNGNITQTALSQSKLSRLYYQILPINEMIGIGLVGFSLLAGLLILKQNGLPLIPTLLTFLTLTYRVSGRFQTLMNSIGQIVNCRGLFLRLREIMDSKDKEFAPTGGQPLNNFNTSLEFKNLCLTYYSNENPAVKNFSLHIPKGSIVALVGASGAGKSSLIDLLLRLYDPTNGQICIDDVDIKNYDVSSWRRMLGVVSQDAIIFNDTIEENIRFGCYDASAESVKKAAIMAQADIFIQSLPSGYQTVVGERGYKLSGGERQRIAFARALIRNPEILILDEATSNLDSQSEALIQQSLQKLRKEKTMIIVAHRLSTIAMADRIYVIEKGELVEQGTHQELLAMRGKYHSYWSLQSEGMKEQVEKKISTFITA